MAGDRPIGADEREATEVRMREILADAGLPQPDEVRYGHGEIELRWNEQKLVVVVDEIPMDGGEARAAAGAAMDDREVAFEPEGRRRDPCPPF